VIKPINSAELIHSVERTQTEGRLRREKERLAETLVEANQELERRIKELNTLYGIGRSVTSVLELDRLLARIVEAAVYITRAEEGSVLLLDENTDELFVRAAQGLEENYAHDFRLRVKDSFAGKVIRSGEPIMINQTDGQHKVKTAYLVNAILYVPLKAKDRVIGVLTVDNRVSFKGFTRNDLFSLSLLSDYAVVAIENARLFSEIEHERRTLAAILSGTQDMIIVTDNQNQILLMNESAQRGFELCEGSFEGRSLTELIQNQDMLSLYAQSLNRVDGNYAEITLGDNETFLGTLSPILGIGRVLVMKNITHLKQLDQMKSDFVSTVSHDLRSPLTRIRGFVDLLPEVGDLNELQSSFLERVNLGIEDISALIDDLLDIGRIEASTDWGTELCDVNELTSSVVEKFYTQAESKKQELTVETTTEPPMVRVNLLWLEQVVTNLVSNAIKYTPEKGNIHVSSAIEDKFAVVHVRDNGIGIPLSEQPFIFDKFYRVHNEATEDIRGTGLGLSIAKSILEKHDGRIWVKSEPGGGSCFSFLLPRVSEQE
jgi:signal transduction histidine kinase